MVELFLILLFIILLILLIACRGSESFQSDVSIYDIPILIISNSDNFCASKDKLIKLGFRNIKRIPPVYLKDRGDCQKKTLSLSELGVTRAHQSCFREVLKMNQDSIILEEDWRYSLTDEIFLKKISEYYNYFKSKDLDLLWLGHCGDACMHAYIISVKSVNNILKSNYCDAPVDLVLYKLCRNKSLNCFKVKNEVHDSKVYYGSGIIFQDRKNIQGIHDHNNMRSSKFIQ